MLRPRDSAKFAGGRAAPVAPAGGLLGVSESSKGWSRRRADLRVKLGEDVGAQESGAVEERERRKGDDCDADGFGDEPGVSVVARNRSCKRAGRVTRVGDVMGVRQ